MRRDSIVTLHDSSSGLKLDNYCCRNILWGVNIGAFFWGGCLISFHFPSSGPSSIDDEFSSFTLHRFHF